MTYRDALRCELARRDFWEYCRLMAPDFYKAERSFLHEKCRAYQQFYESSEEYLIDNEPPRHGKSRTATLFVQWVLGKYPKDKVITGSYNETLSTVFSKGVRNKIQERSADGRIVYGDVFPDTKVKRGDAAANLWGIEGNDTNSYLATSPTGTATGFGADLMLIDDLIKNEYEARNSNIKEQHFKWFTDTMLSRREGKRKVIIVMTRWASDDLAGRVMETLDRQGKSYRLICYKAFDGEKMLCDDILTYSQYQDILNGDTGRDIVEANYNQTPIDIEGRLYTRLQEYEELPQKVESVESYTDTADEGADFLCSIIYAVSDCKAYVLDVIYTQEGMEVTEEKVAKALTDFKVNRARIESNNGGRGFCRNVQRIAQDKYKNSITHFIPFTQTKNKESRILTGSTGVMNNVLFPKGWEIKWSEYWRDMTHYQRIGKNAHDDAQDATTGVYEYLPKKKTSSSDSFFF